MKNVFLILALLGFKILCAQNVSEHEMMQNLILDNFSQSKETVQYKSGKIKKNESRTTLKRIVIKTSTVSNRFVLNLSDYRALKANEFNSLDSSTYLDFISKVSVIITINDFDIPQNLIKIKYIDSAALNIIFNKGGWERFNKTYSDLTDLVQLSRVGFNSAKTQALLYYSRSNCGLCGSGYLCLYELKDGKWILIDKFMEWIS